MEYSLPKQHYRFISSLNPACRFVSEAGSGGSLPHCVLGKLSETLSTCAEETETDSNRRREEAMTGSRMKHGRPERGEEVSVQTVILPVVRKDVVKPIRDLTCEQKSVPINYICCLPFFLHLQLTTIRNNLQIIIFLVLKMSGNYHSLSLVPFTVYRRPSRMFD